MPELEKLVCSQRLNRFLSKVLFTGILIACYFLVEASDAQAYYLLNNEQSIAQEILPDVDNYFPEKMAVGIYVNGQARLDSLYLWGEARRTKAINFEHWLLPVDELKKITDWQIQEVDGKLEILFRNKVWTVPILDKIASKKNTNSLTDSAIYIKDLLTLPGVNLSFDAYKYSIDFTIASDLVNSSLTAPSPITSSVRSNLPETTNQQFAQQVPVPAKRQYTPGRLLVGLYINGRTKLESFYVWGQENGAEAIEFDSWLVPFDELAQVLGWKTKEIDGQLEISTSSQRFKLPINKIISDRNLGRAISIRDLSAIPGYSIKFDIYKYAINLTVPGSPGSKFTAIEPPIVLDGLNVVKPANIGTSIIQQRLNTFGSNALNEIQGDLQAAGNIGDAGWYLRLNQPTINNPSNWNLSDLTFLRQSKQDDQILGSQNPFWRYRNNVTGTYWAATNVHRNGFEPPVRFSGGDYSLNERLQAKRSSRIVSGLAEPGTLVQLVKNDRTQLLQEVLVDSSGVYRFDNVVVSGNLDDTFIGREYQVLLYPRGQLTANPIARDISFTTFSGQIPVGADAFVISAGANRVNSGIFGSFDAPQGGVLYRRGLTDSLTVGAGIAYDKEVRGVGEFFWQPSTPLEISAAATTGSDAWDYVGRLNYRPSQNFYLSGNTDRLSTNASASWRLGQKFTAVSSYDSLRGPAIGGEYFDSGINRSTQLRADIDLQGRTRVSANQRWEDWQASYLGNESANNLQLVYTPNYSNNFGGSGHDFIAGYQASNQGTGASLTSVLWRYRSPEKAPDGRNLWQTELGYGFSGVGSGLLANAGFNITPGLQVRASYRGISDTSSQGSYAIELTTTLFTGNGIRGTYDRVEDFRNLGKLVFQPFLDKNQNGRQDNGEESYWDSQLIRLNEKPIDRFRPQVHNNQGDINLPNGSYRIDIDPAGYPLNYRSRLDALRADITSGGVTTITIPLVQSYSLVGFVKDTKGDAIPGGRVEALNLRTKTKIISITNDSGFYTLEGLEQDQYQITVSDLATTPNSITITPKSPPQQEIDLTIKIPE